MNNIDINPNKTKRQYILLKTLLRRDRSSRLQFLHTNPLDMDMHLMQLWLDDSGQTFLQALRAN